MRLRYKLAIVVGVLGITFGLGRCQRKTDGPNLSVPTVLPQNDVEQIQVDPSTHKLIITTKTGSKTVTLPDRTSTIDVHKDGTVQVTSPQFGFQHHLFVGLVGSEHARLGIGMDAFYWKKLDIGLGIADQIGAYTPIAFAKVTYNVKGNMQIGITYGSDRYVGGIIAVRLF